MKRKVTLIAFSVLLFGCTTTLTTEGQSIKVVDEKAAKECEFVDFISEINSTGLSAKGEMENALVEARNKAAELGANALQIIDTEFDIFVGGMVTANAYKCTD